MDQCQGQACREYEGQTPSITKAYKFINGPFLAPNQRSLILAQLVFEVFFKTCKTTGFATGSLE